MIKKITVLTLFPDLIESYISKSIPKQAQVKGLVEIEVINIRRKPFQQVDDYAFGGKTGMVLKVDSIVNVLREFNLLDKYIILLSPAGKTLSQNFSRELLEVSEHIVLICGHYEGVDARIEKYISAEISIGDYVLSSGELAALVVLDSVVRLIPNVINSQSLEVESFDDYLLDFPVYTRPQEFEGQKVPEVYIQGNHEKIASHRLEMRKKITKKKRPDLYKKFLNFCK